MHSDVAAPSTGTESNPAMPHDDVNQLRQVLLRLARRIRSRYDGDITPSQLAVLTSLLRHGASTVGQIAEREHVKPPSASKLVAALESQGFVERATGRDDRRCSMITVTPRAERFADEMRAAGTSWLAERLGSLSPEEVASIGEALPALERLLDEAT
jgi:DNA-binding MarR family transcriptional regulator